MESIVGIFLILHGLVHFLYAGQSIRLFELQAGMIWPDASWALSKNLKIEKIVRIRQLAYRNNLPAKAVPDDCSGAWILSLTLWRIRYGLLRATTLAVHPEQ